MIAKSARNPVQATGQIVRFARESVNCRGVSTTGQFVQRDRHASCSFKRALWKHTRQRISERRVKGFLATPARFHSTFARPLFTATTREPHRAMPRWLSSYPVRLHPFVEHTRKEVPMQSPL